MRSPVLTGSVGISPSRVISNFMKVNRPSLDRSIQYPYCIKCRAHSWNRRTPARRSTDAMSMVVGQSFISVAMPVLTDAEFVALFPPLQLKCSPSRLLTLFDCPAGAKYCVYSEIFDRVIIVAGLFDYGYRTTRFIYHRHSYRPVVNVYAIVKEFSHGDVIWRFSRSGCFEQCIHRKKGLVLCSRDDLLRAVKNRRKRIARVMRSKMPDDLISGVLFSYLFYS